MTELVVRLVFSLAVVLGLLLLCVRFAGRRFTSRGDALVQVVHRQAISRSAAVSVVNVGGRVLVLGTTEQEVRLLTELDPASLELDDDTDAHDADEESDELLRTLDHPALAVVRDRPTSIALELLAQEPQALVTEPAAQPVAPAAHGRHAAPRHGGARRAAPRPSRAARTPQASRTATKDTPLAGSVLSPSTWKQAWGAATGRAS
ncbi:flagellar biosynthetic protein FliO [Nocardioides anomalus]|uniref:Flagellar biosynthetic protein FliO n=1 Tax=Nocardioides anomalus TaxID=2712223 RepID=A0A6G6WB52_9ACTN|nr:flagellar biosynthetic protein FliO [Nocardioides anomalus]QIG42454.1 flagellar biosynthetic protein FliO [Nocardioides anomalus]